MSHNRTLSSATVAGALLLLAAPVTALPPPPERTATDCAAPVYAIDALVCEDSALAQLDGLLAELTARREGTAEAYPPGDAEWYRHSRMCAFEAEQRDCLMAAYCARLELLAPEGTPADCEVGRADYAPLSDHVDEGFARNPEVARTLAGREIGLWGYVDHGNIYGPGTARDILGDFWSGDGPGEGTWRFDLRPGTDDAVGRGVEVRVNEDLLRDDLLRVFAADAAAGRLTRVFLRGRVAVFEAPSNSTRRVGLRLIVDSGMDLRVLR